MRHYHRSWQDKRPGWTRRIRWYAPTEGSAQGIRLNLIDEDGEVNLYPDDPEHAMSLFPSFKEGKLGTMEILTTRDV